MTIATIGLSVSHGRYDYRNYRAFAEPAAMVVITIVICGASGLLLSLCSNFEWEVELPLEAVRRSGCFASG